MSRYIDADELHDRIKYSEDALEPSCRWTTQGILSEIEDSPTVKAIPKDQYKVRLKADLEGILTELQLEIEEHKMTSGVTNQGTWNECIACCSNLIQQKINAIKAEQEE